MDNFHVDVLLKFVPTVDKAIELISQVTNCCQKEDFGLLNS